MIKALLFDVFGTLVDLTSISKAFGKIGVKLDNPKLFSEIWHSKQIQYALVISSVGKEFVPFSQLSLQALKYTQKVLGLDLSFEQIARINEAKMNLDPFLDSKLGLKELKTKGDSFIVAVLSNGETNKTDILLSNCGLRKYFDYIMSAEDARRYKPFREPYTMTSHRLGVIIKDICLVSSNLWDIAGGRAVGMQTCWINRGEDVKAIDELDKQPDYVSNTIESFCHSNVLRRLVEN